MRKILFIALLCSFNSVMAQNYYKYRNQKINFTEDSTVNLISYSGLFLGDVQLDSIKRLDANNEIQMLRKDQFVASSKKRSMAANKNTYKNAYISKLYINNQDNGNNMVFFLPKIIMQLKPKASCQLILDKYKGQLTLLEDNNGLCKFSCNVSNSDELLNILNDIYNLTELQSIMDWCEPVFYFNLNFFNDPLYNQQYYLKNTGQTGGKSGIDINVEPAWNITKGSSNIRIAVVDEGVEAHEDLGTLLPGYTVGGGNGSPQNADKNDSKAHGEACAGIISALHNNIGIRGIAPDCKIVPVNIAPYLSTHIDPATQTATSFASNEDVATALNWAWHNADVLSCSWGGHTPSVYVENAIDSATIYGRGGKGCVVVFASGNDYPDYPNVAYPANHDSVIAVGAIDKNGNVWNYSERGNALSVVAPSGNIKWKGDVATIDRMGANGVNSGNYMNVFGGTSAACPQVAGVAALILSVRPDLTQQQVRQAIESTCIKINALNFQTNPTGYAYYAPFVNSTHLNGPWSNEVGYGLVNAYDAVNSVVLKISGPSIVCLNSNATYTINNAPAGATITWNQSANLKQVSGSGNSKVFQATGNGAGWIDATVNGTKLARFNLWVGAPQITSLTGPSNIRAGGPVQFDCYHSGESVTWTSTGKPTIEAYTGAPGHNYAFITYMYNGQWTISVKVTSQCGSVTSKYVVNVTGGYDNDNPQCPTCPPVALYSIPYPNPASDILNIDINQSATAQVQSMQQVQAQTMQQSTVDAKSQSLNTDITYDIRLYNVHGHLLRQTKTKDRHAQLNVSHLHNGIYYLHIYDGVSDKPEIQQIIVKH